MADHDNEGRYVWQGSGGCTMCEEMDGQTFDTEPGRPHRNCNCTIIDRTGMNRSCDESRIQYQVDHTGNIHHYARPDPNDEFDMVFDYDITCPDGEHITGQVTVSFPYSDAWGDDVESLFADAEAEALELVDGIAASECQVCGGHPAVA